MKYEQDGVDHINVYSKGKTELGRFLSNFARQSFHCEDGYFESIEGYWYWLGCDHPNKDVLRKLYGFEAKKVGRELGSPDWIDETKFREKIQKAIFRKLQFTKFYEELKQSTLPLTHYYVYGDKKVNVPKAKWILDYLEMVRKELVCEDCGTTEGVNDTTCPFTQEIHDETVRAVLCDHCYGERASDI